MSAFGSPSLIELRTRLDAATANYAAEVAKLAPLQNEIDQLRTQIQNELSDTAARVFADSGKASGDLTITIDGAGKFKASISKTVKWDTNKLQAVAAGMSWDEASKLFKIDFSVPEANYKAAQAMKPELASKLLEARSVKYGDLKIVAID